MRATRLIVWLFEAGWFYARSITRKLAEDDVLFLASGLAFNGILTMIPLMLLSASAIGTFLNSSQAGVAQLNSILDAVFPPQPFATSIKGSILAVVSDIIVYRTSLGLFGVLVLIWTATSLFDALRSVLHRIYRLPRTKGLFASILHDLGFVFLVFVLFIGSNLSIWVFSLFEHLAKQIPGYAEFNLESVTKFVPTLIVILLTAAMFYVIYRHIPDSKPPKAAGAISTVTTTLLWVISGKLFAMYLTGVSAIATIYGPYTFLVVLLFWIYYSSLIFIVGAIVGQVHWERLKLIEEGRVRSLTNIN